MRVICKDAYLSITYSTKGKKKSGCLPLGKDGNKSDGYCVVGRHQELEVELVKGGSKSWGDK